MATNKGIVFLMLIAFLVVSTMAQSPSLHPHPPNHHLPLPYHQKPPPLYPPPPFLLFPQQVVPLLQLSALQLQPPLLPTVPF
ncbi:hypothetical protein SADUNF_Sadunf14G0102700 [Salix dunnii]|uniref:Proline-rich protein n=1 Tax=Salix dunnii TaxID=1413687 RepID=A0A835JJ88_9ROSI|nr:hypothetical protein SADUNF_Sadunf14G0102700 [Salix dunnii]